MPRTLVHFAFILFIVTAISGIWMRLTPFSTNLIIDYEYILHAHSHIAILGWAFLGAFIILLAILWPNLEKGQKHHGIILTSAIFIVSTIMFLAFLYEGYAMYSIILSTTHIFVEYWAIYFIYRQVKVQNQIPRIGKLFINGSLIALILSTIGPFLLGYLGATGMQETRYFDMAIYFFLHFQYNGWLFLFLIGLFLIILHINKIKVTSKLFIYGFWMYSFSLLPWFFSAISWTEISNYDKVIATTGTIGQWISVVILIIAIIHVWKQVKHIFTKLTILSLAGTFLLLFFKATMELGLISPWLSALVFDTRAVVIGYLHLTLLGFISIFIFSQYQMIYFIVANSRLAIIGTIIFISGFLMNEIILFMMGLLSWFDVLAMPYASEGLLLASSLLLIGITFLWFAFISNKKQAG